jgi:hypothetical protein
MAANTSYSHVNNFHSSGDRTRPHFDLSYNNARNIVASKYLVGLEAIE